MLKLSGEVNRGKIGFVSRFLKIFFGKDLFSKSQRKGKVLPKNEKSMSNKSQQKSCFYRDDNWCIWAGTAGRQILKIDWFQFHLPSRETRSGELKERSCLWSEIWNLTLSISSPLSLRYSYIGTFQVMFICSRTEHMATKTDQMCE